MNRPTHRRGALAARVVGLATALALTVAARPADASTPARPPTIERRYVADARPSGSVATPADRYRGVRNAGLALLRRFPPRTHDVVGVGRSGSAVLGFLDALGVATAYLPADAGATLPALAGLLRGYLGRAGSSARVEVVAFAPRRYVRGGTTDPRDLARGRPEFADVTNDLRSLMAADASLEAFLAAPATR